MHAYRPDTAICGCPVSLTFVCQPQPDRLTDQSQSQSMQPRLHTGQTSCADVPSYCEAAQLAQAPSPCLQCISSILSFRLLDNCIIAELQGAAFLPPALGNRCMLELLLIVTPAVRCTECQWLNTRINSPRKAWQTAHNLLTQSLPCWLLGFLGAQTHPVDAKRKELQGWSQVALGL